MIDNYVLGSGWRLAITRTPVASDLRRLSVIPCHSELLDHGGVGLRCAHK